MEISWQIVSDPEKLRAITAHWYGQIACDTETYGRAGSDEARLLGISLTPQLCTGDTANVYIPFHVFDGHASNGQPVGEWSYAASPAMEDALKAFLLSRKLVGHNFTYDKKWIDLTLGIDTKWVSDTRIKWHLASAPAGPRPYGLKDAQVEVLGWAQSNEKELADAVQLRGGKLANGDHYLAPLPILSKYACFDTFATMELDKALEPFFIEHSYHHMLKQMMEYALLLEENTSHGVKVDKPGLEKAHARLEAKKNAALRRFMKQVGPSIGELEEDWKAMHVGALVRESAIQLYLDTPARWKKFNLNSDADKIDLFYGKLGLPRTAFAKRNKKSKSTKPPALSVAADDIAHLGKGKEWLEAYLKYEKANTLVSNFSGPYLDSVINSRLHPGFNICGTVSYRLSGFKPYLLNAPFDERAILKNLGCDPGWGGVHADLAAIEPTVTAHFSDDPTLLKVFRDGLGDIYLDLALELFPSDADLQAHYNPNAPITKAIKERFAKQRKVAKVIQLAVQYTGTGHTVAKTLNKEGIPTTIEQADGYVRAYWRKFSKVASFNYRLRELNRKDGHLRNIIGRIIQVPDPDYKDLPNRYIQSSAHDVLILWVLEIYRLCQERNIPIKPVLLDCHDSTSNQTPVTCIKALQLTYHDALANINYRLGMHVTVKAEVKTFSTLAGLKGEE